MGRKLKLLRRGERVVRCRYSKNGCKLCFQTKAKDRYNEHRFYCTGNPQRRASTKIIQVHKPSYHAAPIEVGLDVADKDLPLACQNPNHIKNFKAPYNPDDPTTYHSFALNPAATIQTKSTSLSLSHIAESRYVTKKIFYKWTQTLEEPFSKLESISERLYPGEIYRSSFGLDFDSFSQESDSSNSGNEDILFFSRNKKRSKKARKESTFLLLEDFEIMKTKVEGMKARIMSLGIIAQQLLQSHGDHHVPEPCPSTQRGHMPNLFDE